MSADLIIAITATVIASAIAVLVLVVAKRSLAHILFSTGLLVLAGESMCVGLAADAILPEQLVFWARSSLVMQAFLPLPWLAFSLVYARGNAQEELRRHRLFLFIAPVLATAVALAFWRQLVTGATQTAFSGRWAFGLGAPGYLVKLVFLIMMVLVLMNLERTFRASVGTMRWRVKFILLGLGILFVVRAYTTTQAILFRAAESSLGLINNTALLLSCLIMLRSLFRAGNFDVSVYPSRSIIANSFTVILAGIYLFIVGLLSKTVSWIGGESAFALRAFLVLVALIFLAVLLLSDRIRLRTTQFVSRHFQRPAHDYRSIWEKVTQASARCVDQRELAAAVSKLASEIFQALSVSLWLVDSHRRTLNLCASTSCSGGENLPGLAESETDSLLTAFAGKVDPVDIDRALEPWAIALRRLHPDQFKSGGNRVCVPLVASGELLGFLIVGDRVGGVLYSIQDFDLLKSFGTHIAAGLLNIQLSQRLAQAKQLEAFQAMSAFFVHDLKNTASTLSLMLKNLPLHYQDPAFREDALRGISRTIEHINDMVGRLNMLRHELAIQAVECDLNQLVHESLQGQEKMADIEIVKSLNPLPRLRLDPSQIQKVLTNLLLNSREAMPSGGEIRVETSRQNGWAVLAVTDHGCGMSQEFIRKNLFRPFQTTKKRGMGIGMFHCKMIVEAHNGRIEVTSQTGKGTTFQVLLPLALDIPIPQNS